MFWFKRFFKVNQFIIKNKIRYKFYKIESQKTAPINSFDLLELKSLLIWYLDVQQCSINSLPAQACIIAVCRCCKLQLENDNLLESQLKTKYVLHIIYCSWNIWRVNIWGYYGNSYSICTFLIHICTMRTCTFGITNTVKVNILNTHWGYRGVKQCTKGSSGVQSQEKKTLYGRESLIVMAEHFKCISNTVVGTVQYWITVIWLFTFKIVF